MNRNKETRQDGHPWSDNGIWLDSRSLWLGNSSLSRSLSFLVSFCLAGCEWSTAARTDLALSQSVFLFFLLPPDSQTDSSSKWEMVFESSIWRQFLRASLPSSFSVFLLCPQKKVKRDRSLFSLFEHKWQRKLVIYCDTYHPLHSLTARLVCVQVERVYGCVSCMHVGFVCWAESYVVGVSSVQNVLRRNN